MLGLVWLWFVHLALAEPGIATLEVGVLRAAGDISSVIADGATGDCERNDSTIRCRASGPVEFSWAGDSEFALEGALRVHPGEKGTAFVLGNSESCASRRAILRSENIQPSQVIELFLQVEDELPEPVCHGMIDDLVQLTRHSNRFVRQAAVDAMFPLMRDTASDPFWPHAPDCVPAGVLLGLTQDSDRGVRRRTALLIREGQTGALDVERQVALRILATDPLNPVRRPAVAALPRAVELELMPAELAWHEALGRIPLELGAGRAAVGALARMAKVVSPSETIVPERALELTMRYHPERAWVLWRAWREEIPFHSGQAERLLLYTAGLNETLLKHWATSSADELVPVLEEWHRLRGQSRRFELAQAFLRDTEHPGLRTALRLDASTD